MLSLIRAALGQFYFVGLPDKFHSKPSDRLPKPFRIYPIPTNPKVFVAHSTPDPNTSMPLFLVLFNLIFKSSKAQVARSNRAGQAKCLTGR